MLKMILGHLHLFHLDIKSVDFLQFQGDLTPLVKLEEDFIYIMHKPIDFSIDFSYRFKRSHWLETSKSVNTIVFRNYRDNCEKRRCSCCHKQCKTLLKDHVVKSSR